MRGGTNEQRSASQRFRSSREVREYRGCMGETKRLALKARAFRLKTKSEALSPRTCVF